MRFGYYLLVAVVALSLRAPLAKADPIQALTSLKNIKVELTPAAVTFAAIISGYKNLKACQSAGEAVKKYLPAAWEAVYDACHTFAATAMKKAVREAPIYCGKRNVQLSSYIVDYYADCNELSAPVQRACKVPDVSFLGATGSNILGIVTFGGYNPVLSDVWDTVRDCQGKLKKFEAKFRQLYVDYAADLKVSCREDKKLAGRAHAARAAGAAAGKVVGAAVSGTLSH